MMKKMWKMRKDKSAVSPVIATILMVAILMGARFQISIQQRIHPVLFICSPDI